MAWAPVSGNGQGIIMSESCLAKLACSLGPPRNLIRNLALGSLLIACYNVRVVCGDLIGNGLWTRVQKNINVNKLQATQHVFDERNFSAYKSLSRDAYAHVRDCATTCLPSVSDSGLSVI